MYKLILISSFCFSISFFPKAFALPDTVVSKYSTLVSGCEKLSHSEWIKRYSLAEDQVIEGFLTQPSLSLGKDKELFEVMFPQDLPKSHPMRGAFLGCFEVFNEYQKAINNVQSMSALKRLESCYQEVYKKDPPEILGKFINCLKRIQY